MDTMLLWWFLCWTIWPSLISNSSKPLWTLSMILSIRTDAASLQLYACIRAAHPLQTVQLGIPSQWLIFATRKEIDQGTFCASLYAWYISYVSAVGSEWLSSRKRRRILRTVGCILPTSWQHEICSGILCSSSRPRSVQNARRAESLFLLRQHPRHVRSSP